MENQNRWGRVLLLLAGFALVLCVGMVIGGAVVYGVLRISEVVSSRAEPETLERRLEQLYDERIVPEFASGAVIVEVTPGSPAEEAGLQEGDVIVAVDSQQVGPDGTLAELIAEYEPGDRLSLQVQSEDEEEPRAVRVELGENPDVPGAAYLGVRYQPAISQGMPFREMLPFNEQGEWQLDELPLPGTLSGANIMVASVTEGSPADDAGLQRGDAITSLDGESLDSTQALIDAIGQREPGERVTLGVIRAGEQDEVELEIRLGEHPDQAGKAYLGVTIADVFRQFRGPGADGEWMPRGFRGGTFRFELPSGELPFNWDDLRRWFQMQPQPEGEGAL